MPVYPGARRVTANPDGTRKWGYFRVGEDTSGTQKGASFPLEECIGLLPSL